MHSKLVRPVAALALAMGALALAGCGESAQQKATAQVCSARSDIAKQIKTLEGLPISVSFLDDAEKSIEAIGKDLRQIKDAQPNLAPARKEQVAAATDTFEKQMSSLAAALAAGIKAGVGPSQLAAAGPEVKAGLSQLAGAYKQALAPISCS